MSDVIDLSEVRRRKKDEADGWEIDDEMKVSVVQDPEAINFPIIRLDTSDYVVEQQLTPEEARAIAYSLLNLANTPEGIILRGHAEGDDP